MLADADADFLSAIAAAAHAHPTDDTPRLAYADWLDEQGDPRGEYVRLRIRHRAAAQWPDRLLDLDAEMNVEWAAETFCVPRLSLGFAPTAEAIVEPVTKFGGQPVWLTGPEWPQSRRWADRPMQFVCQVEIPPWLGVANARMAYLFLTHQAADERDSEGWFFDPDANDPDAGENAVILQPGGTCPVETLPTPEGPTLYADDGTPVEVAAVPTPTTDPAFTPHAQINDDAAFGRYFDRVWGEKVGGTSIGGNGNGRHIDILSTDPEWRFLLQLQTRRQLPFCLNLGVDNGFVFVKADGSRGVFLTE